MNDSLVGEVLLLVSPLESGLSREAQKLLLASYRATLDQGKIFRLDVGTTHVRAGARLNEQGPLWRLALDELVEAGYAERQNDALYELTKRGFEKAALISATADEEQENDKKAPG